MTGDRWACFAIAWDEKRVASMDASLAAVRDWLVADGVQGYGTGGPEWAAARQRAMAAGLKSREAWLCSDVLMADARRLMVPGARVLERARNVTMAVQGALRAQRGTSTPVKASAGVLERSAVEQYAVAEHAWTGSNDPAVVVEDLPWPVDEDRTSMRALPVTWQGLVTDPVLMGGDGAEWREYFWRHGAGRPGWADDPLARHRLLMATRALGWSGVPLRADLDEVEPYLPMRRVHRGYGEHMAWLVPGVTGVGWAFAWQVPRARV